MHRCSNCSRFFKIYPRNLYNKNNNNKLKITTPSRSKSSNSRKLKPKNYKQISNDKFTSRTKNCVTDLRTCPALSIDHNSFKHTRHTKEIYYNIKCQGYKRRIYVLICNWLYSSEVQPLICLFLWYIIYLLKLESHLVLKKKVTLH